MNNMTIPQGKTTTVQLMIDIDVNTDVNKKQTPVLVYVRPFMLMTPYHTQYK